MSRKLVLNIFSGLLFVATTIGVVAGLVQARGWVRETYGDGSAQVKWNDWVTDVKEFEKNGESPVARRIPKSAEPPGLVLMRDYFWVCLVICLVLSLALATVFNFMVRGVLSGSVKISHEDDDSSAFST
ncbi:MAG: hypothetical protein ACI9HK_003702 [Pirellulaceae bacterium]|jgi:hypothetical protein